MPLPRPFRFPDWPDPSTTSEGFQSAGPDVITIPVTHEMGSDLKGGMIESTRLVGPSKRPVIVKVESRVVTQGVQGVRSPEYLAAVRRRRSRALAGAVADLSQHAGREDFVVCTYPVLKQVNDLLATLNDGAVEGNTREILRHLRSSLMNGGWNKYRNPAARRVAVDILNGLAEADEVLPQRVDESFDKLFGVGLNPVGAPLCGAGEEDQTPDGEDQVPG